jgi:hypothetical protein
MGKFLSGYMSESHSAFWETGMTYQPPVMDLMFCIEHPSHLRRMSALGAYSPHDLADVGEAMTGYAQNILPECATEQARVLHGSPSLLDATFPE